MVCIIAPFTYTLIRPIYVGMCIDQLILIVLSCFCDLYLWWSDWILERYLIIKGRCRLKKKNRFVVLITNNVNVAFFTSWQVLFCSSFNFVTHTWTVTELCNLSILCVNFCMTAWSPNWEERTPHASSYMVAYFNRSSWKKFFWNIFFVKCFMFLFMEIWMLKSSYKCLDRLWLIIIAN